MRRKGLFCCEPSSGGINMFSFLVKNSFGINTKYVLYLYVFSVGFFGVTLMNKRL